MNDGYLRGESMTLSLYGHLPAVHSERTVTATPL